MEPETLVEYRYRAVCEALGGSPIGQVAASCGTSRQSAHTRRPRSLQQDVSGSADRSRRPHISPNHMDAEIEALTCEPRQQYPRWGGRTMSRTDQSDSRRRHQTITVCRFAPPDTDARHTMVLCRQLTHVQQLRALDHVAAGTLSAAFSSSWQSLSPRAQTLLAGLAHRPTIAATPGDDALTELLHHHLITASGGYHYTLNPLAATYIRTHHPNLTTAAA